MAISTMGILAFWQGDYQAAIARYEESILQNEKVGYQYGSLWNHVRMAHVFLRQGEVQRARMQLADCIEKAYKANFMIVVVYAIEGLASLNITQGKNKLAIQLYAWADAMREKIGDQRPPVERDFIGGEFAIIHSRVDNNEIADITEKARTMSTEQAIALALEE
jgi:tetratricopeptide (TPR) repeat protein